MITRQMIRLSTQAMLTTTRNSKGTNADTAMRVFYSQLHLTNHITHNRCKKMPQASNVQQKKEECSRCGKTFKSRAAHCTHFFDKHVKEPDGSMNPHCEPCLVVFSSAKGLKTHCTHSVDHECNTKFL